MATMVASVEEFGDASYQSHGVTIPRGYIDAESDKDIGKIVNFVPDAGLWTYVCRDAEEQADRDNVVITVYWTERDGRIVVSEPTAGKHEREELASAAQLESMSKKARSSADEDDEEAADGTPVMSEVEEEAGVPLNQSQIVTDAADAE